MNLGFPSQICNIFYINWLFKPTKAVLYPSAETQSEHSQEFKLDLFTRTVHGFKLM